MYTGHVNEGPGAAAEGGRANGLQPQLGHFKGILSSGAHRIKKSFRQERITFFMNAPAAHIECMAISYFILLQVITTRSYDDRLRTIANVREAGLSVCSGGILGLGEVSRD